MNAVQSGTLKSVSILQKWGKFTTTAKYARKIPSMMF
jgi:hypothetical protein